MAFTVSHYIIEGYDFATGTVYGVNIMTQWQDGEKVALSPGDLIYPDTIVTGTLTYPDWDGDGIPDIND